MRHNQACIKNQLAKFLDFELDVPNRAELVNNYDWMKDFTFLDFVREVGKHITVNYMMAKDSVKRRLNGEARDGLSFTKLTTISLCNQRASQCEHLSPIGTADQFGTGSDVSPLVGTTHLELTPLCFIQMKKIISLKQLV